MSSLPADIFDKLTNLTSLSLSGNELSSLPADIFDKLTNLTELRLSFTKLRALPAGIFDKFTNLRILTVQDNELLRSLPAGIFDELTNLTSLDLGGYVYGNDLRSLPTGVFDSLTNLTYLSLVRNQLRSLPTGIFDKLTKLTSLWLYVNQLSSLRSGIFKNLTNLTYLSVADNQLRSLPAGIFENLTKLTGLSVARNSVDPLPLTVSLVEVGEGQFKATVPTGAPFDIVLPLSVTNGSIKGSETAITIPAGKTESEPRTVIRAPGTSDDITVNINILPGLPADHTNPLLTHTGYTLVKSSDLPLVLALDVITEISDRTPAVRGRYRRCSWRKFSKRCD